MAHSLKRGRSTQCIMYARDFPLSAHDQRTGQVVDSKQSVHCISRPQSCSVGEALGFLSSPPSCQLPLSHGGSISIAELAGDQSQEQQMRAARRWRCRSRQYRPGIGARQLGWDDPKP